VTEGLPLFHVILPIHFHYALVNLNIEIDEFLFSIFRHWSESSLVTLSVRVATLNVRAARAIFV